MISDPLVYFSTIVGFLALLVSMIKYKSSFFSEIEKAKKEYIIEIKEKVEEDSNIEDLSIWCGSIIWLSRVKVLFKKGIQASILLIIVSAAGLCIGDTYIEWFPFREAIYFLWIGVLLCVIAFFIPALWWALKKED